MPKNLNQLKFDQELKKELKEKRLNLVKDITKKLATPKEFEKLRFFYIERTGDVDIDGIQDDLAEKVMKELEKQME